jgi:hypothetical protein
MFSSQIGSKTVHDGERKEKETTKETPESVNINSNHNHIHTYEGRYHPDNQPKPHSSENAPWTSCRTYSSP